MPVHLEKVSMMVMVRDDADGARHPARHVVGHLAVAVSPFGDQLIGDVQDAFVLLGHVAPVGSAEPATRRHAQDTGGEGGDDGGS